MASRPVFVSLDAYPYYKQVDVEFVFHSGFALSQKQKNIVEVHKAFKLMCPEKRVLEISSKSTEFIGTRLSAFNVLYDLDGFKPYYQGSYEDKASEEVRS